MLSRPTMLDPTLGQHEGLENVTQEKCKWNNGPRAVLPSLHHKLLRWWLKKRLSAIFRWRNFIKHLEQVFYVQHPHQRAAAGRARWPTSTVAAAQRIDFCSFLFVNKCSRTTQINKFPECPEHRKLLWQPQLWDTNKTFQIYTIAKFSPSAAPHTTHPAWTECFAECHSGRRRVCVCVRVQICARSMISCG